MSVSKNKAGSLVNSVFLLIINIVENRSLILIVFLAMHHLLWKHKNWWI